MTNFSNVQNYNREEQVQDTFWREFKRALEDANPGEKLSFIGDLTGRMGDEVEEGVIESYRVPGVNGNNERIY